jgi:mannose-1-phosphate guanylyltransferase
VVEQGIKFVGDNDTILTIGIQPNRPETGYGYIQIDNENSIENEDVVFNKVKTFTEKPDLKLAKVFLESGEFFWNSGIFFWSVSTILQAFKKFLPEINNSFLSGMEVYGTSKEADFIEEIYSSCKNISIDYGIMEKSDKVYVLTADFGWSDLGTWGSLFEQKDKDENNNVVIGDKIYLYDSKSTLVNSMNPRRLAVIEGLEDFIVVDSNDILLICRREHEQKIKSFVNDIKLEEGEEYI